MVCEESLLLSNKGTIDVILVRACCCIHKGDQWSLPESDIEGKCVGNVICPLVLEALLSIFLS